MNLYMVVMQIGAYEFKTVRILAVNAQAAWAYGARVYGGVVTAVYTEYED